MSDAWSPKIAAFVVQALDLEIAPLDLVPEIVALKREDTSGISAVELQSSVGPTPFLVYHYQVANGDQSRFDADIATLEKAAALDSPGPRIVAHASTGDEAFILTTTPSVQRSLTGRTETKPARPPMPIERARTRVPDRLIDKLREANRLAGDWLTAIRTAGENGNDLSLTDQEAALALFLLDDRSIQDLLQALNVLISTARNQAGEALG
ncbi:MAG TPA: hypothetical protein VEQ36_13525 [Thermomicrobiales bacterium]|nr:hypothetical protein [Thermomicrobiales bacterium]